MLVGKGAFPAVIWALSCFSSLKSRRAAGLYSPGVGRFLKLRMYFVGVVDMFCKNELRETRVPEIWTNETVDWNSRRLEIADILQSELFGYRPADPEEISFEYLPIGDCYVFCGGKVDFLKILIHTKVNGQEFSFPMYGAVPKGRKNLPFFIHISFKSDRPTYQTVHMYEPPFEEIIDNGFAIFWFGYEDVTADNNDFTDGLAGVLYGGRERTGSDPGKIAMWSWAASRVMDFCQTLDCLDLTRSAVIGHSRLGKTALFTGVMDERIQFVIGNGSGFAGAALSRNYMEERRCSAEFCIRNHGMWFAENYKKYANREYEMPYDQHFLVVGSAPRHVYVGSADQDYWATPRLEFLSAYAAGEVYERLGLPGLVCPDRYPESEEYFHNGYVGYHLRRGMHCLSRDDWKLYMQYVRNAQV